MPSTLLSTSTPTYIHIVYLQSWVALAIAQFTQPYCLPGTTGGFFKTNVTGYYKKQPIIVTFPLKVSVVQKQYEFLAWGGKSGIKKTVLIVTSEEVLG